MAEPWKNLDGKVAMVTGAFSGSGLKLCLVLPRYLDSLCDQINKSITDSSSSKPIRLQFGENSPGRAR